MLLPADRGRMTIDCACVCLSSRLAFQIEHNYHMQALAVSSRTSHMHNRSWKVESWKVIPCIASSKCWQWHTIRNLENITSAGSSALLQLVVHATQHNTLGGSQQHKQTLSCRLTSLPTPQQVYQLAYAVQHTPPPQMPCSLAPPVACPEGDRGHTTP